MSLRRFIAWVSLKWDAFFLAAHREPEPAAHPAGCACIRCDKTVPEAPCDHPAELRYKLDTSRGGWWCGSCGDPCEPPAVLPDPRGS